MVERIVEIGFWVGLSYVFAEGIWHFGRIVLHALDSRRSRPPDDRR